MPDKFGEPEGFYVDFRIYNKYQYTGYLPIPIPHDEKYRLMYRVYNGKTEVMQYRSEKSKFYDDIRKF
ncbi:MAG: hypothetical protein K2L42_02265 [Clostridia bacterium]|nr:hypothetical protein [Clostridia bacterium]